MKGCRSRSVRGEAGPEIGFPWSSRSGDRGAWRIKDGNSRESGTESIPERIHKTERIRNIKKY